MKFASRDFAGMLLAKKLTPFVSRDGIVVLGIARGGVVVGSSLAKSLHLPFDIVVAKKIGAPHNPELAIGAVAPKHSVYFDKLLCEQLGVSSLVKRRLASEKIKEQEEKERALRGKSRPLPISGKTIILVDDGVATGATAMVCLEYLKKTKAKDVILAVPVISKETYDTLSKHFATIVTQIIAEKFYAVGQFYKEFPQISDEIVIEILRNKEIEGQ